MTFNFNKAYSKTVNINNTLELISIIDWGDGTVTDFSKITDKYTSEYMAPSHTYSENKEYKCYIWSNDPTVVPGYAFDGLGDALTDIKIPYGVKIIGEFAFAGSYKNVRELELPDSVEKVDAYAFAGAGIEHIKFSKRLKEIEQSAFIANNLKEIILPEGLESLGSYSFGECNYATEIYVPRSVQSIPQDTFVLSTSTPELEKITIPFVGQDRSDTNSYFGFIFGAQDPLESHSLMVPASLKTIVVTEGNNGKLPSYAFNFCPHVESVELADSITSVEYYAFSDCYKLHSIKFSNNIQVIGEGAFVNCSSLEHVVLPAKLESLHSVAFNSCSNLNSIKFGNSVQQINNATFADCQSLKEVVLPESLSSVAGNAFSQCTALEKLTIEGTQTVMDEHESPFYGCTSIQKIIVPIEALDTYKNMTALAEYKDKIVAIVDTNHIVNNEDSAPVSWAPDTKSAGSSFTWNFNFKLKPKHLYSFIVTCPSGE